MEDDVIDLGLRVFDGFKRRNPDMAKTWREVFEFDKELKEKEVEGAIETYREFGTSEDDIIKRIMKRFNVTKEYVQALLSPQAAK